ncbi:MAG: hypothetical protein EBT69_01730 [Verrucomicrobia bacterium]|nr:hypothetical protein [Verrucomicrobiota bacterium]
MAGVMLAGRWTGQPVGGWWMSEKFDGVRARQDGGIAGSASIQAPRGSDQRPGNDLWSGYFKISK